MGERQRWGKAHFLLPAAWNPEVMARKPAAILGYEVMCGRAET